MISLGAMIPKLGDATSWYRAMGPLGEIARRKDRLAISVMDTWNWPSITGTRGVFMQRPFTDDQRVAFDMIKNFGRKIWIDYDDYLFDIPTDNPTFFNYMNQKTADNIKYMIKNADVVTVSTEELKTQYSQLNPNVIVIPNALDPVLMKFKRDKKAQRVISWRGSRTHQKDVFLYSPMIVEVANSQYASDWQWHFIGDNPWFLTDRMPHKRTYITKPMDIVDYHEHLTMLGPMAMVVPLHECTFNKAKSNIAWLEASLAGGICLGPDWAEWKRPGMLTYASREDFKEQLKSIVQDGVDTEKLKALSWEYIMENLRLDKVNAVRLEVICQILGCEIGDLGAT